MSKNKQTVFKYINYILFLIGIWIIVTFFIAGGVYTSEVVINPDNGSTYHFTVFQVMFGKSVNGLNYFKPNLFGFIIILFLVAGLIIPTIHKVNRKIRHSLAGFLLLVAGLALFALPSVVNLGNGWQDPTTVVITLGPALLISAIITVLFSIINFVLALIRE